MSFKIVHKTPNFLFACGFYTLERAQRWIEEFDPSIYTDTTLKKEDLLIQEEKTR